MKQSIKRLLIAGICCLAITPMVCAQKLAKDVFINMPDSLSLLLTAVNRADCIDFLESNMAARVENRFGKTSEMTALTDDYIQMKMTSQSSWEMKVLPLNDSIQVICTISTVCAPACDSDIRFYDMEWKELPKQGLMDIELTPISFMGNISDRIEEFAKAMIPSDVFLTKASFNPDERSIQLEWTTPDYMEKEAAEKIKPFIGQPLVFKWVDGRFIPESLSIHQ